MKIIFSTISRLIFSYSKFLATLAILTSLNNNVYSSNYETYLKNNEIHIKHNSLHYENNDNIRTKKFDSKKLWNIKWIAFNG